jgi:hypothetical protein
MRMGYEEHESTDYVDQNVVTRVARISVLWPIKMIAIREIRINLARLLGCC